MYEVADKFDVTESSVHLTLTRFLNFLQDISAQEISWPSLNERSRIQNAFFVNSGGKGLRIVNGCIDGCHIPINKLQDSGDSYYNRKKLFSIILQGICARQEVSGCVYRVFRRRARCGSVQEQQLFQ